MIHELRRYTVKPGKLADYVEKSGSIGRPIRGDRYGKLLGYWSTELGPLNQVVHLWEYADLAARTAARAGLAKDERWVKEYLPASGPLLDGQENMILTPFDWAPFRPTTGMGIHELRVYRLHPGKAAAYSETMREALPTPGEALRARWATGSSRSARSTASSTSGATGTSPTAPRCAGRWRPTPPGRRRPARLMPLLQSQEATILVPTSYSPCR